MPPQVRSLAAKRASQGPYGHLRTRRFLGSCIKGTRMAVFVLDKAGRPLMPCTEKRARLLLQRGRARVHRLVPFVIRLVDRQVADCAFQSLRVKIDPGSKHTGLALVRDAERTDTATGKPQRGASVLNLFELVHRGRQISEALTARRAMRRRRRGNLRYRPPRFLNRTHSPPSEGLTAPSVMALPVPPKRLAASLASTPRGHHFVLG